MRKPVPPAPAGRDAAAGPAAEPDSALPGASTRGASLWPASEPSGAAPASTQTMSRFDPAAEQRAREQELADAAFDVCHPGLGLRAVLLVQLVLAIAVLGTAEGRADWIARQGTATFCGAGGTVMWLVVLCALRPWMRRHATPARAAAGMVLGAAVALAAWLPLVAIGLAGHGGGLRVAGVMLAGAGFGALLLAWLELRARIWQPANASARLAELQSRIRPHFLFNALNTALALVRVDPARAEAVLEDLAELFRGALADVGVSVSLDEEVELARRYLAIEQERFGRRLQVHWAVDAHIGSARVPPLMLQPLVENAVRHGVEPALDGGQVWIEGTARRGQAVITVRNTLGDEPSAPGHGMALHNVRERLRLLHDVAGQLDTWREGGQFHARVTVPL